MVSPVSALLRARIWSEASVYRWKEWLGSGAYNIMFWHSALRISSNAPWASRVQANGGSTARVDWPEQKTGVQTTSGNWQGPGSVVGPLWYQEGAHPGVQPLYWGQPILSHAWCGTPGIVPPIGSVSFDWGSPGGPVIGGHPVLYRDVPYAPPT